MTSQKKFFEMLSKGLGQRSTADRTISKIFTILSKNPELATPTVTGNLTVPVPPAPAPVPARAHGCATLPHNTAGGGRK